MGLGHYVAASSEFPTELEALLGDAALDATAADIKTLGETAWLTWQLEHQDEIAAFVAATPSERQRLKKWRAHAQSGRLIVAAMLHCQLAHAYLDCGWQNEGLLGPGQSYRHTTALAGILFWQLRGTSVPLWPDLLEERCPSPFPDWQGPRSAACATAP